MVSKIAVAIVLVSYLSARVEITPGPIEARFGQASLVCRGLVHIERQCAWPEVNGKLKPADCHATISIEGVYKGQAAGQRLTLVFLQVDPLMGLPVVAGREYLFFLRPSSGGAHVLRIESSGAVVSLQGLSLPAKSRKGVAGLAMDIIDAGVDAEHSRQALDLLSQFAHLSEAAIQRLQAMPAVTLEASVLKLAVSARSQPTRYLPALVTGLETWTAANPLPDPAFPTVVPPSLTTIGDTLARMTSVNDITSLKRLASSDQPFVRLSAMQGIKRLKDPATVPFLIAQLDSTDNSVRYLAVVTLAAITGKSGDFGPGKGRFDRDEHKYITVWKNWWTESGRDRR